MPFKVVAECIDIRNGRRFQPGEMFEPLPEERQAKRLLAAGCIEVFEEKTQLGTGAPAGTEPDPSRVAGASEPVPSDVSSNDPAAEPSADNPASDVTEPVAEAKSAKVGKARG